MKPLNEKQIKWRQKMAVKYRRGLITKFMTVIVILFTIQAVYSIAANPQNATKAIATSSAQVLANMALIGSIDDVADKEVAGGQIAYQVHLIETCQVDSTVAFPLPNANRELGTIPLKAGEYAHYFDAHDIPTDNSKGEKGDVTVKGTNTFAIIMGGNRAKLLDFIEEHAGGKFIVIYRRCDTTEYFVQGTYDKPMILKSYERKNDKDSRSVTYTFENETLRQPKLYIGTITTKAPAIVSIGAATALTLNSEDFTYNIASDGTANAAIATISGNSASLYGRVITLRGTVATGGKDISIAENAIFILVDGTTWHAWAGSRIAFRILDANTLVEVEGSRVQTT